jgi:hypothetical protein
LNSKYTSNQKIEAEMLTQIKHSFAIKFSTDSKNVSMCVLNDRQHETINHSDRHYKTGQTEKREAKKPRKTDISSVGAPSQSDYNHTVKGSVA